MPASEVETRMLVQNCWFYRASWDKQPAYSVPSSASVEEAYRERLPLLERWQECDAVACEHVVVCLFSCPKQKAGGQEDLDAAFRLEKAQRFSLRRRGKSFCPELDLRWYLCPA